MIEVALNEMRFRRGEIFYGNRHTYIDWVGYVPDKISCLIDLTVKIVYLGDNHFEFVGYKIKEKIIKAVCEAYGDYCQTYAEKNAYNVVRYQDWYQITPTLLEIELTPNEISDILKHKYDSIAKKLPNSYKGFDDIDNKIEHLFRGTAHEIIPDFIYDDFDFEIEVDYEQSVIDEFNERILNCLKDIPVDALQNLKTNHPLFFRVNSPENCILDTEGSFYSRIVLESANVNVPVQITFSHSPLDSIIFYELKKETITEIQEIIDNIEDQEVKSIHQRALDSIRYNVKNSINGFSTIRYYMELRRVPKEDIINRFPKYLWYKDEIIAAYELYDKNSHWSDDYSWGPAGRFRSIILDTDFFFKLIPIGNLDLADYNFHFNSQSRNKELAIFALWSYFTSMKKNKRQLFSNKFFSPFGITGGRCNY